MASCILNEHLTMVWLPQETRELQKKSRWELIKETLNKEFTSPHELKASSTYFFLLCAEINCLSSCTQCCSCYYQIVPQGGTMSPETEAHREFVLNSYILLLTLFFNLFLSECSIEIQCVTCPEMGFHSITSILH